MYCCVRFVAMSLDGIFGVCWLLLAIEVLSGFAVYALLCAILFVFHKRFNKSFDLK